MEIEIVTTKKKLTKSIISQMRGAGLEQLKNGKVLGYVIGVLKENYKAMIIEYESDYYIISCNYTKGESTAAMYRKIGKWSNKIRFNNFEERDEFWEYYTKAVNQAKHIYI